MSSKLSINPDDALKLHESCEHPLDHIRVCVVTTVMITPANGKATSLVCFYLLYPLVRDSYANFTEMIYRKIGWQRAKYWQIQAKCTIIAMLEMEYSNMEW